MHRTVVPTLNSMAADYLNTAGRGRQVPIHQTLLGVAAAEAEEAGDHREAPEMAPTAVRAVMVAMSMRMTAQTHGTQVAVAVESTTVPVALLGIHTAEVGLDSRIREGYRARPVVVLPVTPTRVEAVAEAVALPVANTVVRAS